VAATARAFDRRLETCPGSPAPPSQPISAADEAQAKADAALPPLAPPPSTP